MTARRRALTVAGAVTALAVAAALLVLAADVRRWRAALDAGDVQYLAAPGQPGLWRPATIGPAGATRGLLGVSDDLRFRDSLRALRLGRLERGFVSDPAIALPRAEAQALLGTVAKDDPSFQRRSRAMGLLGVIAFAGSVYAVSDRDRVLDEAVGAFQAAIATDPGNDEAKANLERILQRRERLQVLPGGGLANPSRGGPGARGAGAGKPGSGY